MRFSLLFFYVLLQITFIAFLPFIAIIYFLFIPLFYLKTLFETPEDEKKKQIKDWFLSTHLLNSENQKAVENWFEEYYKQHYQEHCWWKLSNLLTFPPLGRDWAVGYTPTLDNYCEELTSPPYQKKTKNIIDREKEITQIERILTKSEEANVIIVGEAGIGKHTIIDALAKKIYEGTTSSILAYKRVLKINMEKILSLNDDKNKQEAMLEELFTEAAEAKNIIIFIDNFEKYHDFYSIIEKFAKTPLVQFIAITLPFFYQKIIFPHEKIVQLFSKIDVYEVTKEEAEKILLNFALNLEKRYKLIIPYETIKALIEKSDYYITYIPFPEKAIQLLDEACVLTKEIYHKNNQTKAEKETLPTVTPEIIDKVLFERTHIPISITSQMRNKLLQLENLLKEVIIHQDEAINQLSSALHRSFILIGKRKKPLASFLFLGPTGVGKTETAKTLSEFFFQSITPKPYQSSSNNYQYLIRFDMSNYQLKEDIPKLIGDIKSDNPGLLSSAIREHPYGVLLLDELEKANHDLLNIFLTIIDEGYFTDGYGKRVDCKNLIIIATSNAGSDYLYQEKGEISKENFIDYLINNKFFSPEFLNRFDGIVLFKPLTNLAVTAIAKKMLIKIVRDIYQIHKIKLEVSDEFINNIVKKAYQPQFGARHVERIIKTEIENKLAKIILEGKAKEGDIIRF